MSWTKRQFVEAAFEEIGLAAYVYDLQPEQMNGALRRLDTLMATWNAKGIRLGYPLPSTAGSSDLDQFTDVPDSANEAIILNLAIRLAPAFGKSVSMDTKMAAKQAYKGLASIAAFPQERQFPKSLPRGAGNKPWSQQNGEFMDVPEDPLAAGPDGPIDFD